MRYKENVMKKLEQLDIVANRINLEVGRGFTQDTILTSVELLKEHINGVKEMISVEPDDFEQQFRPSF